MYHKEGAETISWSFPEELYLLWDTDLDRFHLSLQFMVHP